MAIDVVGVVYGFIYYGDQFAVTPTWTWAFVPNSPLAVLWALLALLLVEFKRESAILESLAFVGNIEIGLWTAFVLYYYRAMPFPSLNFVLFWAHLAMVAHAFVFAKSLRSRTRKAMALGWGVAAAYYLLDLYLHYFWTGYTHDGCVGLHPIALHSFALALYGDPCAGLGVVAGFTVALCVATLAFLGAMLVVRNPAVKGPTKKEGAPASAR
jgi:uncharacterized membrane protein YpjA